MDKAFTALGSSDVLPNRNKERAYNPQHWIDGELMI
jgi:hypothetical protein